MNLALWITQALLAAGFFFAGMLKLVTPRDRLIGHLKMGWAEDLTAPQIRQIAYAELLGRPGSWSRVG